MSAFAIVYLCVFGIGSLFPISKSLGFQSIGLKLILGFLSLPVLILFLHLILNFGLKISCKTVVLIAFMGLLKHILTNKFSPNNTISYFHPIIILPIAILALAQFQGGITYFPYSGDEFSGWLTIPKQAFALGEFDREQMRTAVKDYVPSWYLFILFPSVLLSDTFNPSNAALIPVIFHIGLMCLIFDIVSVSVRKRMSLKRSQVFIVSWVIILLFLTVQTAGAFVPKNLLIEPPQIYGFSIILVLLTSAAVNWTSTTEIFKMTGVLCSLIYFIKSSCLVFVPSLTLFLAFLLLSKEIQRSSHGHKKVTKLAVIYSFYLLGPVFLAILLWKFSFSGSQTPTGSPSLMFSSDFLLGLAYLDISRITYEFNSAVTKYIFSYKIVLTLFSSFFLFFAFRLREWRPYLICIISFLLFYYLALYWSHLTLFSSGPTSVPRYMRIPIQVIHTVGLYISILLIFEVLLRGQARSFALFLMPKNIKYYVISALMILGGWQIFYTKYLMSEIGLRNNQTLPPHTKEIKAEAQSLNELVNFYGVTKKNILLINHPYQPGIHKYAWYHLVKNNFAAGLPKASLTQFERLSPIGMSGLSKKNWKIQFTKKVALVDIIWPIESIDPSGEMLETLDIPLNCRVEPKKYFLIRTSNRDLDFVCIAKF